MVPPADYVGPSYERVKVGSRSYSVPNPPTELPDWLPLNDGHIVVNVPYAVSDVGALYVTRLGLDGDTVYHRELNYTPVPYTEAALDALAARQPMSMINGVAQPTDVPPLAVSAIREKMNFPAVQLPVERSWLAQDESVWLRRAGEPGRPVRWVLLDSLGTLRGQLELPANVRPLWSRGDILWAAVPDDLDVPWLVRYRIETAAEDHSYALLLTVSVVAIFNARDGYHRALAYVSVLLIGTYVLLLFGRLV
jgi:hypothetical protein